MAAEGRRMPAAGKWRGEHRWRQGRSITRRPPLRVTPASPTLGSLFGFGASSASAMLPKLSLQSVAVASGCVWQVDRFVGSCSICTATDQASQQTGKTLPRPRQAGDWVFGGR